MAAKNLFIHLYPNLCYAIPRT